MFLDATKVIIVESSISSKKTGPRKGSIGYITSKALKNFISYYPPLNASKTGPRRGYPSSLIQAELADSVLPIHISSHLKFYVKSATIFFIRYGYEKKSRYEKKDVFLLFPVEKDIQKYKQKYISKKITERILKDVNLNTSEPINNIPIVIAAPYLSEVNAVYTDDNEAKAIINSMLYSYIIKLYLKKYNNIDIIPKKDFVIYALSKSLKTTGTFPSYEELRKQATITTLLHSLRKLLIKATSSHYRTFWHHHNTYLADKNFINKQTLLISQLWKIAFISNYIQPERIFKDKSATIAVLNQQQEILKRAVTLK